MVTFINFLKRRWITVYSRNSRVDNWEFFVSCLLVGGKSIFFLTAFLTYAILRYIGNITSILKFTESAAGWLSTHNAVQFIYLGTLFMFYSKPFGPKTNFVNFDFFITNNTGSREFHWNFSPAHFNSSISFSIMPP